MGLRFGFWVCIGFSGRTAACLPVGKVRSYKVNLFYQITTTIESEIKNAFDIPRNMVNAIYYFSLNPAIIPDGLNLCGGDS